MSRWSRRLRLWPSLLAPGLALTVEGCGSSDPAPEAEPTAAMADPPAPSAPGPPPSSAPDAAPPHAPLELHFALLHGVQEPADYAASDDDMLGLQRAIEKVVESRRAEIEAARGAPLVFSTHRFNLYEDLDGKLLSPGLDDGTGPEVAARWRAQAVKYLEATFSKGEKNVVLVGHSTGARVAMELAANVGGPNNTVGAADYGLANRIAGVISINGMIGALNDFTTVARVVSFENGCKLMRKPGWCSYAANVSSAPAADFVAKSKRTLVLGSTMTSACGPLGAWAEDNDQALPLRAQGSPSSVGLTMITDPDGLHQTANVVSYGAFCHPDVVHASSPRHEQAIASVTRSISDWLFVSAPRVVNAARSDQTFTTDPVQALGMSPAHVFASAGGCPAGGVAAGLDVVGACRHPGGADHTMDAAQLLATPDRACGASVAWKNSHADAAHAGVVWFKTYAAPSTGGLLSTLR